MKYLLCILACLFVANITPNAQETARAPVYEYAVVKWDGPDRLYYNLPDQFEVVQMKDRKVPMPKDAQPEEFWLAYAANEMWDLCAVPVAGGAVVNRPRSADITEQNVHFSPDGKTIAFTHRPKDQSSSDVMVMTLADHSIATRRTRARKQY